MKVLVIMPYQTQILRALDDAIHLKLGTFILVGSKNRILELCFKENVQTENFKINDFRDPIEVVAFCKDLLSKEKIDFIVFGDLPSFYQSKILDMKDVNDIGNIDIIDLPFLKHFIFVSNNSKYLNVDFDDKKRAIVQGEIFMKSLNIKKINVALITNMNNKIDILEANIIKMILKDNDFDNINIFDSFNIVTLFSKENSVNIFNSHINLIIMRNYEASKIFVETLSVFTNAKIANILVSEKYYAIDANQKEQNNILFSLMLINKLSKNESVVYPKKKCII